MYSKSEVGTPCWRFLSFYCPFTVIRPQGTLCWFWSFSYWLLKGRLGDVWRSFGLPDVINRWAIGGPRAPSLPKLDEIFDNSKEAFDDLIFHFLAAYPRAVEQMSVRLCKMRLPANTGYRHM